MTISILHGAVSMGHTWWKAPKDGDFIKIKRENQPKCLGALCSKFAGEGACNPILTQFIDADKKGPLVGCQEKPEV